MVLFDGAKDVLQVHLYVYGWCIKVVKMRLFYLKTSRDSEVKKKVKHTSLHSVRIRVDFLDETFLDENSNYHEEKHYKLQYST